MADRYLLESGAPDGYLLEDSSGVLLLDQPVLTVTARHAGESASTAGQTLTSGAHQPTSNSLLLVFASVERNNHSTAEAWAAPVGGGWTYNTLTSTGSFQWSGVTGFEITARAWSAEVGVPGSAHSILVDAWSAGTQTGFYSIVACDIIGYNLTTPIVQTAIGGGQKAEGNNETGTVTFDNPLTAQNVVIAHFAAGNDIAEAFGTPNIGGQPMTQLHNQSAAFAHGGLWYRIIDGTESNRTVTCPDLGQSVGNFAAIAVEVAAAAPGGSTQVGKDLGLVWDTRAAVGDQLQAIWDVRSMISDDLVSIWDVRSIIGDSVTLSWDLRAPVGDELALVWDADGPVGKNLSLVWDVRSILGDQTSLAWDIRASLSDELALVWDIRALVSDSVSLSWDVRSAVADDLALVWDVRSTAGDSLELLWHVSAAVGDVLELLWDIESILNQIATKDLTLNWAVDAPVGKPLSLVWDTRAIVNDSLELQWSIRSILGDAVTIAWDIRAETGRQLILLWDARSVVGDTLALSWALNEIVGDDLVILWAANGQVGKDLVLIWHVDSDLIAVVYLFHTEVLERWRTGVSDRGNGVFRRHQTEVLERWRTAVKE